MIDSIFRTGKNYYHQVFLEECKYIVKEIKMPKYINDDKDIKIEKWSKTDIKIFLKKKKCQYHRESKYSFWGVEAKANWVYEKLLFST